MIGYIGKPKGHSTHENKGSHHTTMGSKGANSNREMIIVARDCWKYAWHAPVSKSYMHKSRFESQL